MAKKKQIIRSTIILVVFIYLCLIVYSVFAGYNFTTIFSSIKKSLIFIVAGFGLGFSIVLVSISGTKNYVLSRALRRNGNGRYGTTSGFLPQVILPQSTKLVINTDLPKELASWLEQLVDNKLPIKNIFINAAEILKAHLDLTVVPDSSISLYAHSIQVSSKLLEFKNSGATYCKNLISDKSTIALDNNEIESLLEILPLLGILHDLGKIVSSEKHGNTFIYSSTHPAKARLISTQLQSFWELDDTQSRAILFALGNYLEPENAPKIKTNHQVKSVEGIFLIKVMAVAHTEVTPYEKLTIITAPSVNDVEKVPVTNKSLPQVLDVVESTPIMIPKPKPRVVRAPKEQVATVESPVKRIVGNKKINKHSSQKLDDLFSQAKKNVKPEVNKETEINVNELFAGPKNE